MVKDFRARRIPASFRYAWRGIWHVMRTEQNIQIHFFAALVVILLATYLGISRLEWAIILLATGGVITAEVLNTVIEDFLDVLHPEHHQAVRRIKDALAGAVLVSAIVAVSVGVIVFLPYLVARLTDVTV